MILKGGLEGDCKNAKAWRCGGRRARPAVRVDDRRNAGAGVRGRRRRPVPVPGGRARQPVWVNDRGDAGAGALWIGLL